MRVCVCVHTHTLTHTQCHGKTSWNEEALRGDLVASRIINNGRRRARKAVGGHDQGGWGGGAFPPPHPCRVCLRNVPHHPHKGAHKTEPHPHTQQSLCGQGVGERQALCACVSLVP